MSDDTERPGTPGTPFFELSKKEQDEVRKRNAGVIDLDASDLSGRASAAQEPVRERNVPLPAGQLPRSTTPPTLAEIIKAQPVKEPKKDDE